MQKEQYIKIDEHGDTYYFSDKHMSVLHREDGPAIEYTGLGGGGLWYRNGKLHREDGPAIETKSGYSVWYQDGAIHREDGPAIEYIDGGKSWYYKGKRHRVGGPAVERVHGQTPEWWVNDVQMTSVSETFLQLKKIIELSLRSVRQIDRLPTSETETILPAVRIDILETATHAEKLLSKLMGGKSGLEQ